MRAGWVKSCMWVCQWTMTGYDSVAPTLTWKEQMRTVRTQRNMAGFGSFLRVKWGLQRHPFQNTNVILCASWKCSKEMWNAIGNGSGFYSGGGGGYLCKAHGWEFVPCSLLEREGDRGVTSTASVGHFAEHSGLGRAASPSADLQSQHLRLRKRFEELRKRHGQEKDAWMKEKEMLLREVADVQVMHGSRSSKLFLNDYYSLHI